LKIIIHIITSLNQGGAENALYKLVTFHNKDIEHVVISLMDNGFYGQLISNEGIRVETLQMPKGRIKISSLFKLYKLIKLYKPDIIQTWMYHADLIGGIIAKIAGHKNIFWGIHNFNLDINVNSKSTVIAAKFCAYLSNIIPNKIITCSSNAINSHVSIGYTRNKFVIIPLGYDVNKLFFDPSESNVLKSTWNCKQGEIIIGCVARWDQQKDHLNLFKALSILNNYSIPVKCILVGSGMTKDNNKLLNLISITSVDHIVKLVGPISNINPVFSTFDIHVLSSLGEAFPNVVAESMCCKVPCVVTNVGDASYIVGNTGWVVPPSNPELLATSIYEAITEFKDKEKWSNRKEICRNRIIQNFTIEKMYDKYLEIWN
jgi:glycosyltransferase involved in cell wall biosynthesis